MDSILDKVKEENRHASAYDAGNVKKVARLLKKTIDQIRLSPDDATKAYGLDKKRIKKIFE